MEQSDQSIEESPYLPLFLAWFLYHRTPEGDDVLHGPRAHTVAARYLRSRTAKVLPVILHYIEAATREPLCFWEVESVVAGRGVAFADLATGRRQFVSDVAVTRTAETGKFALAKIVGLNGIYVILAMGPYLLPSAFKGQLTQQLRQMGLTPNSSSDDLLQLDLDFLAIYQRCVESTFSPASTSRYETDRELLDIEAGPTRVLGLATLRQPLPGATVPDLSSMPSEHVTAMLAAMEKRFLRWADEHIPLLDGQTPRQAVHTADGRTKVLGLLADWDRNWHANPSRQFDFDFNGLRRELGLPEV